MMFYGRLMNIIIVYSSASEEMLKTMFINIELLCFKDESSRGFEVVYKYVSSCRLERYPS